MTTSEFITLAFIGAIVLVAVLIFESLSNLGDEAATVSANIGSAASSLSSAANAPTNFLSFIGSEFSALWNNIFGSSSDFDPGTGGDW